MSKNELMTFCRAMMSPAHSAEQKATLIYHNYVSKRKKKEERKLIDCTLLRRWANDIKVLIIFVLKIVNYENKFNN